MTKMIAIQGEFQVTNTCSYVTANGTVVDVPDYSVEEFLALGWKLADGEPQPVVRVKKTETEKVVNRVMSTENIAR